MSIPQKEPENNIIPETSTLDRALRPSEWADYVGQEGIKTTLRIIIDAARQRGEPIEHLLLYGPAGLGKTTLANLIAREMGANLRVTSGPAIERVGDLASILTNLTPGDVLFIDEIHRMNKMVEEVLYPAMESRTLDIILGKGPSARTIQLDLPPFTLIGATTRISLLSSPLRSRFSAGTYRLEFYTEEEIERILTRSAHILRLPINENVLATIASRSRATPRIANQLLKRCRDVADIRGKGELTPALVAEALSLLAIDDAGLGAEDRKLLTVLIEKFRGGPVGLSTLATAVSEDAGTVEDVYEPFLIRLGFLDRTSRGRVATARAYTHLGFTVPESPQSQLLS